MASGLHEIHKTQLLCPSPDFIGVSVFISQNLTVVSPDPDASFLPSGENYTDKTASVWPGNEELYLVIGLT